MSAASSARMSDQAGPLVRQQPALDRQLEARAAVRETAQAARGYDAVARDDEREGIVAAGLAHRARRRADRARQLAVASRLARRNRRDAAPDPAPELGPRARERQVPAEARIVEVALDLAAGAFGERVPRRERPGRARQVRDLGDRFVRGAHADHAEGRRHARLEIVAIAHRSDSTLQALAGRASRLTSCAAMATRMSTAPTMSAIHPG